MVCCSSDEDDGKKRRGCLFVSCGDSPPLLEPCPQVFDQMPMSVSPSGTGDFWIILSWRDDRTRSPVPEIFMEFMRGIATGSALRRLRSGLCLEPVSGSPMGQGLTPGHPDKTQRTTGRLPQMDLSAPTSRRKPVGTSQGVEGGRHTIRKNRHILHGRYLHRRNRRSSQDLTGPRLQFLAD